MDPGSNKIPNISINGFKIPQLGFGTFMLDGAHAKNAVLWAFAEGYRHIDTAKYYENEEYVGSAIQDSKIPREDLFVVSKMWPSDHGYDKAIKACNASLKRLQTPYLDLYLIHWPGVDGLEDNDPKLANVRAESWRAFEKLHQEGKCKSIGVSNYTIHHLEELLKYCKVKPAVNQVEFHPKLFQKDLLEYCENNGIVLTAYSPFAKGELLDDDVIQKIANFYNKTAAQIILRWCIQHKVVVIPKASTKKKNSGRCKYLRF